VVEIPILTYRRFLGNSSYSEKTLTITGSSILEIEELLWEAYTNDISPIVVLTHAHEYVKSSNKQYGHLRPNRVNQNRLIELCNFLTTNSAYFQPVTFSKSMASWLKKGDTANPRFKVSMGSALHGIVQNKLNDTIPWY
jgi:hypothetical protein